MTGNNNGAALVPSSRRGSMSTKISPRKQQEEVKETSQPVAPQDDAEEAYDQEEFSAAPQEASPSSRDELEAVSRQKSTLAVRVSVSEKNPPIEVLPVEQASRRGSVSKMQSQHEAPIDPNETFNRRVSRQSSRSSRRKTKTDDPSTTNSNAVASPSNSNSRRQTAKRDVQFAEEGAPLTIAPYQRSTPKQEPQDLTPQQLLSALSSHPTVPTESSSTSDTVRPSSPSRSVSRRKTVDRVSLDRVISNAAAAGATAAVPVEVDRQTSRRGTASKSRRGDANEQSSQPDYNASRRASLDRSASIANTPSNRRASLDRTTSTVAASSRRGSVDRSITIASTNAGQASRRGTAKRTPMGDQNDPARSSALAPAASSSSSTIESPSPDALLAALSAQQSGAPQGKKTQLKAMLPGKRPQPQQPMPPQPQQLPVEDDFAEANQVFAEHAASSPPVASRQPSMPAREPSKQRAELVQPADGDYTDDSYASESSSSSDSSDSSSDDDGGGRHSSSVGARRGGEVDTESDVSIKYG